MNQTNEANTAPALDFFGRPTPDGRLPAVFGGPGRYVQGPGVLRQAGAYVAKLGAKSCGVLLSARSQTAEGADLLASLSEAGIGYCIATFGGECTYEEIALHTAAMQTAGARPDVLIALGGGKVVDTGKVIADRLGVPAVIVPSLASNDAPCSAASVIYTADGETAGFEIFSESPALVLVDTEVIAAAPKRFLVAGMGDGMATWYEARACSLNPRAVNSFGGRPTRAGTAIAELCARTIYEDGEAALAALDAGTLSPALDRIIEANTLLSGVGFESGGVAASHGIAQAYPSIRHVHDEFLHGEMVAMGVLAQLALEDWTDEADRATRFFNRVGLPVTLKQLGISRNDHTALDTIVAVADGIFFTHHMHVDTSPASLKQAILNADARGQTVVDAVGDTAFRALRA